MFTLSSHWLLAIFTYVVIGHRDYVDFGFKTLNRKALYQLMNRGLYDGRNDHSMSIEIQ